jgi:crossover junction endodeoxyribonuclease RuvC
MRIIGVDPGSVVTGIGVIEAADGKVKLLDYSVLTMNSKMPMTVRLKKVYDCVIRKLSEYKPDELAIETQFYGKNIQSTLKLGQIKGTVIIAALNSYVNVVEYSPREIKKSVTGSGASSKQQVQYMVKTILSMRSDNIPGDASDALAIALCHNYSVNGIHRSLKNKKQKGNFRGTWKEFIDNNPSKIYSKK